MRKILGKILFLAILFMGVIWIINIIFIPKRFDGITPMLCFYEQEGETVDALFLGSSHCGVNTDMGELWKSYGISGYALWGSEQPSWNSYYYLREALKTQTPKVVVYEVFILTYQFEEYQHESRQLTNTGGMRLSYNKWKAIQASAPRERWLDLILGYPLYHDRYNELTEEDFSFFPNNKDLKVYKGTTCRWGKGDFELADVSGITECAPVYEKEEKYLKAIIELCQQKGIPIILYATPEANREIEQPYYNSIAKIAEEYEVDFLNLNLMDTATGFTKEDIYPDGGHLNTSGARKIAHFLGKYLQNNYGIEDHRGQMQYVSWDQSVDMLEREYLPMIQSKEDYFLEVSDTEYICLYMQKGEIDLPEAGYLNENAIIVNEMDSIQNIVKDNLKSQANMANLGEIFSIDLSNGIFVQQEEKVLINETGNGSAAIIYDPESKELVDIVVMMENNNFSFEHRSNPANTL